MWSTELWTNIYGFRISCCTYKQGYFLCTAFPYSWSYVKKTIPHHQKGSNGAVYVFQMMLCTGFNWTCPHYSFSGCLYSKLGMWTLSLFKSALFRGCCVRNRATNNRYHSVCVHNTCSLNCSSLPLFSLEWNDVIPNVWETGMMSLLIRKTGRQLKDKFKDLIHHLASEPPPPGQNPVLYNRHQPQSCFHSHDPLNKGYPSIFLIS